MAARRIVPTLVAPAAVSAPSLIQQMDARNAQREKWFDAFEKRYADAAAAKKASRKPRKASSKPKKAAASSPKAKKPCAKYIHVKAHDRLNPKCKDN